MMMRRVLVRMRSIVDPLLLPLRKILVRMRSIVEPLLLLLRKLAGMLVRRVLVGMRSIVNLLEKLDGRLHGYGVSSAPLVLRNAKRIAQGLPRLEWPSQPWASDPDESNGDHRHV